MQRKTALLVLALSLMAGALYAGASRTRASQAFSDEIPSPSQWVPFSADLRLTHLEPHGATAGRFWRAGDGSTRLETWAAADPTTRLISIKNISQRTSFVKNPRGVWSAAPMDVPLAGWLPRKYRYSMPGLSEYSKRLDILEGRTGSLEAAAGMRAFQFASRNGTIWFLAPDLNFFPVVQQAVATGRREEYSNIKLGEPDTSLFEPPAGVALVQLVEPRGIIDRKAAALRARAKVQAGGRSGK